MRLARATRGESGGGWVTRRMSGRVARQNQNRIRTGGLMSSVFLEKIAFEDASESRREDGNESRRSKLRRLHSVQPLYLL